MTSQELQTQSLPGRENADEEPNDDFMTSDDDEEYVSQDEEYPVMNDDVDPQEQPQHQEGEPNSTAAAKAHLAAGSFDKAIQLFTEALKECGAGEKAALLLQRADASCRLSRHLRGIPADVSERRAVYAPDPQALASSALRDAESALRLEAPNFAAVHQKRGDALFLLERYIEAQEAYRLAAAVHLPCSGLQCKLEACEQALSGSGGAAAAAAAAAAGDVHSSEWCSAKMAACKADVMQDAECTLCLKLLYEPVTTPCGHTFCGPCLVRSFDHSNSKCPMCRAVVHVGGAQLPVSYVLKGILQRAFPEDYEARRKEEEAAAAVTTTTAATLLPLFVMSPMLPGERCALNIFEPRYRLMIRRVMAGGRRFGMATVNAAHALHDVCCEVEVTECEPLPDGRFYIEIVGRRRFKPRDSQEQDGYRVAFPEYVNDAPPAGGSPEAAELVTVAAEVENLADDWIARIRTLGQTRRAAAELLRRMETKPPPGNMERLSFWVANLVCPLVDDQRMKLRIMSMTSTLERLKLEKTVLGQLQTAQVGAGGCSVM